MCQSLLPHACQNRGALIAGIQQKVVLPWDRKIQNVYDSWPEGVGGLPAWLVGRGSSENSM